MDRADQRSDTDTPNSRAGKGPTPAARAIAPQAAKLRDRVFDVIAASPHGMAADEVARALGLSVLSVRPRVSELKAAERICATNHRVKNDSGNHAKVWIDVGRDDCPATGVASDGTDPRPTPSGRGGTDGEAQQRPHATDGPAPRQLKLGV